MSFKAFKRLSDGEIFYAFEGEEDRIPNYNSRLFRILPNDPVTILATTQVMSEHPLLDSIDTADERDRLLTMEAEDLAEAKAYQKAIINM